MNYIVLLLGAVVAAYLVYGWIHHPRLLITVGIGLSTLEGLFGPANGISMAGIVVYPPDLLWATAGIAAWLVRPGTVRARRVAVLLKGLLTFVLVLALIGSHAHGVNTAGAEARTFFYFFAAALAVGIMIRDRKSLTYVVGVWLVASGVFVVAAAWDWAHSGIHGNASAIRVVAGNALFAGLTRDGRALSVKEAIIIAQSLALIWLAPSLTRLRGKWRTVAIAVGSITLVLLQQRTAWIAALVALLFYLFYARTSGAKAGSSKKGQAIGAIVALLTGLWLAAVVLPSLAATLGGSADTAFSSSGTFAWRVQSWLALLGQGRSALEWFLGTPFGAGYERVITVGELHGAVSVNPHSFYVQSVLRLGVLGTLFMVWMILRLVRDLARSQEGDHHAFSLVLIILLCQFVTYPPAYAQGIALGLAIAAWATSEGLYDSHRSLYDEPQSRHENYRLSRATH